MHRVGRFKLSEVTWSRLLQALKARMAEIPHGFAWEVESVARKNRALIRRFQGLHDGKRCFLVANGPSLAKTNLDLLVKEYTFGLNRIYLNFPKSPFRPTYYVTVNELILQQFASEIAQLDMPKFLNWNRRSHYGPPSATTVFLKSRMAIRDSFQYDLTQALVFGATVTFTALQLAYYMGFQKAVIVGLDHHYAEKGVPSTTEMRTSDQDDSHFHPQYFPKGIKWQLPDLLRSEIDFELARRAFEMDGREILDATIGGNCQVFRKADYLSLF